MIKTKKYMIITIALVLLSLCLWYYLAGGTLIRLQINVVDELGNPVENVLVTGYFDDSRKQYGGGKRINLITDKAGQCSIIGVARAFVGLRLRKNGYYETSYRQFILRNGDNVKKKITVVIKKMKNQVAMQARNVELTFPELEKYYPFDCDVGDWVEPYGNGKKSHIYIYYCGRFKDMFTGDSILKIKTEDKDAGFQISEFDEYSTFRSMYLAPTNNYTNVLEFITQETKTEVIKNTSLKDNQYIIFKVQNSTNSTMYNYGKIYYDINYGPYDGDITNCKVWFTYYYNPTPNDRNLEFDPKQNLIKTYDKRGRDMSDQFRP